MDDANVPSLLAMPYLGSCSANDPLYLATRRFVLSEANPYFFRGSAAEGIGGPHIGQDMIWPMAIIMRALTTDDENEQRQCLAWLKTTHAGTGFMHESFNKNDPAKFTRAWFAWANTLFGELILTSTRPIRSCSKKPEQKRTGGFAFTNPPLHFVLSKAYFKLTVAFSGKCPTIHPP